MSTRRQHCFMLTLVLRDSLVAQTVESALNAGDLDSIPGSGRSPGEGNGRQAETLEIDFLGMCLSKHARPVSHCYFPLTLHPPFRTHPNLGHRSLLGCLGGCTLRKEAPAGDPSTSGPGGRWLFRGPRGQRFRPPSCACTRFYGPSHGKPESTGLSGAQFRAPRLSAPLQSSHVTEAWSGSREWKAAQGREIRRNKIDIALISCGCCVGLYLICDVVLVSVHAPDSVMTFT